MFEPTTERGFAAKAVADAAGVTLVSWAAETSGASPMTVFEIKAADDLPPRYWTARRSQLDSDPQSLTADLYDSAALEIAIRNLPAHRRIVREAQTAINASSAAKIRALLAKLEAA